MFTLLYFTLRSRFIILGAFCQIATLTGGVEAKGKKRRVNTQQAARIGMELYEWLVVRGRERWNKKGEG